MNTPQFLMQAAPEQGEPLTHGFLLVEPATMAYTPDLAALDMRACTPRVLAHREELMPRLIDLRALDPDDQQIATDHWQAEVTAERPPVVCAWIESAVDAEALAVHVARYLVGPGADGNPVFWRYYDPRVLVLALIAFSTEQRQSLLRPVRAWRFPWAGHVWSVAGPGVQSDPVDQPHGWPSQDQWPRINQSEAGNQVLRRLPPLSVQQAARLPALLVQLMSSSSPGSGEIDTLVADAWQHLSRDPADGQRAVAHRINNLTEL